jgi:hypothetical protein
VIQPLGDSGRGLSAGHTVLEYSALGHRDDRPRVLVSGPPAAEWNGRLVVLLLYAGIPGTALAYWVTAMASSNLSALTTALGLLANARRPRPRRDALARGTADAANHRGDRAHSGRDRHRHPERTRPGISAIGRWLD